MVPVSPIVLMQRRLYGMEMPSQPRRVRGVIPFRAGPRLGAFGIAANPQAGSSVYSGPPVGAGSGKGAVTGAAQGASVGAVAGPIGMAIGAAIGAIGGAIAGALGKRDPEQANFDQAVAIYNANPNGLLALVNKYLALAGLFDLKIKTNIPIYRKYGRMGEQRFLTDMAMLIHDAAVTGKIGPTDTPQTIMVKVVQPWIDSWGFGPMVDMHSAMINMLLMGLIIDYVTGNEKNWLARGGQYPFQSLPAFALPVAVPPPVSAPAAPPVSAPAAPPVSAPAAPPVSAPAPPPVSAPAAPPVSVPDVIALPGNVLSADGSTATPGSNTGLKTPGGVVFYFGPAASFTGDFPVYMNGKPDGSAAIGLLLFNGGHLYQKNMAGSWSVWMGSAGWSPTADPTAVKPQTSPTASTTVPIPAGFLVSGIDSATGLPIYSTVSGGYFTWNGTTMTPFTGTLTSGLVIQGGGAVASNNQALPMQIGPPPTSSNLPALNTGSQQLFNSALPGPDMSASQPSQVAPAQPVATAGVSGLPSWVSWGAVASVVVLMFATARPAGRVTPRGKLRRSR